MSNRNIVVTLIILTFFIASALIYAFITLKSSTPGIGGGFTIPNRQFAQANDTKRRSDIFVLLNAISQYTVDHSQNDIPAITEKEQTIAKSGADLCSYLVPTYVPAFPTDPQLNTADIQNCDSKYDRGYTIKKDSKGRITVKAPFAEVSKVSVTR